MFLNHLVRCLEGLFDKRCECLASFVVEGTITRIQQESPHPKQETPSSVPLWAYHMMHHDVTIIGKAFLFFVNEKITTVVLFAKLVQFSKFAPVYCYATIQTCELRN